jgi:hypothetical protein
MEKVSAHIVCYCFALLTHPAQHSDVAMFTFPKKTNVGAVFGKTSDKTIQKRQSELGDFLKAVVQYGELRDDREFRGFIGAPFTKVRAASLWSSHEALTLVLQCKTRTVGTPDCCCDAKVASRWRRCKPKAGRHTSRGRVAAQGGGGGVRGGGGSARGGCGWRGGLRLDTVVGGTLSRTPSRAFQDCEGLYNHKHNHKHTAISTRP